MTPMKERILKTAEDVKEALEEELKHKVNPALWDMMLADRYVQETIDGEEGTFKDLVAKYRERAAIFREHKVTVSKEASRHEKVMKSDKQQIILEKILAYEASNMQIVTRFRKNHIGGFPLERSDEVISGWLKERYREGVPFLYVVLPLPFAAHFHEWFEEVAGDDKDITFKEWYERIGPSFDIEIGPGYERMRRFKSIPEAGRWSVDTHMQVLYAPRVCKSISRDIPIGPGHEVLWELKKVSLKLTGRFLLWQESDAVDLVLTGHVPALLRGRSKIHYSRDDANRFLEYTLSPRLSSKHVAKWYRGDQRRFLRKKRMYPLSEKHLNLALYYLKYDDGGISWQDLNLQWNNEYPKWRYDDRRNFCHDVCIAYRRVRGRKENEKDVLFREFLKEVDKPIYLGEPGFGVDF